MTSGPSAKTIAHMQRYQAAAHAMQSGVAFKMGHDPNETNAKHLRVGVNSALRDSSTLARLLMAKGLITEEEYVAAQADGMEEEAELYRRWLSDHTGVNITLS